MGEEPSTLGSTTANSPHVLETEYLCDIMPSEKSEEDSENAGEEKDASETRSNDSSRPEIENRRRNRNRNNSNHNRIQSDSNADVETDDTDDDRPLMVHPKPLECLDECHKLILPNNLKCDKNPK